MALNAPSGSCSSKVLLHPLVIMQMSEHYSRTKVQQGPTVKKVFGAILGRQNGRQVEAINSFVLKMETEEMAEPVTFSTEHLLQRADQYLEVFPELQVIGLYCAGEDDNLTPEEKPLLSKLTNAVRNSEKAGQIDATLFLKLNSITAGTTRKLPLFAFEADVTDQEKHKPIEWILVSEESERVGVNHIAKLSTKHGKDGKSVGKKHAEAQDAAMSMLQNRVDLIVAYLEKVQDGTLQPNFEILKEANLLAQKLKTIDRYAAEFTDSFEKEEKTMTVFSLMPRLTTLLGNMQNVWNKLSAQRADLLADDGFHGKSTSRWAHPVRFKSQHLGRPQQADECLFQDDDYFDDEDLENDMSGPRRKIHAADSPAGSRRRRVPPRAMNFLGRNSGMQAATDEMELSGQEENMGSNYIPDVPRPSATAHNESDESSQAS
ncbi:COP9 signalosome complex subunit 6 [Caenorhabditis elegans]|uniref:COP9 signalosome complex subunit 6 n=1 Tax=Caenorhabditis elegans TaxID=6239 RepID=C5VUK2_CAEEL|nr:MPN domain-containing protein [Caenorhabditis elegans]CAZ65546.1 MPN domain-containing protein [Caenorhabditis elegans]|eukprot:NP_001255725.1 COP9 signalosome complex subunit 6 [Caenorhabditis elegans]